MSDLLLKTIAENIIAQRKKRGLSQKELAAKLAITNESMGRIERGVMAPKFSRLQDIADTLQCSVAYLMQDGSPNVKDRAQMLAELLNGLPTEKQEAVMDVMYTTVNALKKG